MSLCAAAGDVAGEEAEAMTVAVAVAVAAGAGANDEAVSDDAPRALGESDCTAAAPEESADKAARRLFNTSL